MKIEKLKLEEIFVNPNNPRHNPKGKELYTNFYNQSDHEMLSKKIQNEIPNDKWVVTYDNCTLIKDLYADCNLVEFSLSYSAGKAKVGQELFITKLKMVNLNPTQKATITNR